ncbi:Oidioi.mRNA.OKI2018_I69.chr1.g3126.t1.cds [Oikopleura dioica]|uniref:Oidioi.mRNA.OKI2018_I69.chr1.g3126.t1.cds n=1 Tax=Oikopleura dioica TaxID=34765 RepID=A0ABN7T2E5_OIKDI|nr:Oidioi.mRNA.OKI2018_I69.chr1.g3126.t1.cds [Oikopleura dioica]
MIEILYSKTVNVLLSREQVVRHWLKLEIEKNFTVHEKSYRIRLTDPTDFFFLYTKSIAENDYNLLKAEQQLSIDFHTFPSILIELINETTDSNPSKRIEVTCQTLRANLAIVEPRKIRNITELNLELTPANDSEQKVYLASSLKQLQTESAEMKHRNETKIDQLQKQLSETTQRLEDINNELESLKIRGEGKAEEIRLEYEAKINEEKRKALKAEQDARVDFDAKTGSLESAFEAERRRFEVKISDLENIKEELSQKKIRAENTVREQKIRIDQLTHEQSRISHENQKSEQYKNELDKKAQSREEQLFALKSELAAKTLEINELKTNISRMSYQTRTAEDQQASKDEKLQQIQGQCHKLERDNEVLVADLAKANEIISRKMDESKTLKEKYRRNSEIIKKQEKLLTDKDSDIKKLATKLRQDSEVKQRLEAKQTEISGELESMREKLEAAVNKNSQDDKVIQYLSRVYTL